MFRATSALRTMSRNWTHLVRFLAKEDGQVHLGQIDAKKVPDVGLALEKGEAVSANLVTGGVFDGVVTERSLTISHVRTLFSFYFLTFSFTFVTTFR